jgi:hypothetical protein
VRVEVWGSRIAIQSRLVCQVLRAKAEKRSNKHMEELIMAEEKGSNGIVDRYLERLLLDEL